MIERLEKNLQKIGYSLTRPQDLAGAVKQLSDYYIAQPASSTPWHKTWAQAAYLAYFHHLNTVRMQGILKRLIPLNAFQGLSRYLDFGSGLGSTSEAMESLGINIGSGVCVELSDVAIGWHQTAQPPRITWANHVDRRAVDEQTLVVWSYSFTELDRLPEWASRAGALLIVEPATKEDSERLMKLRQQLIDHKWHVWAPCTHQLACPLLNGRDWCHDRIEWEPPSWYLDIERHLPMKNRTLPASYLYARRIPSHTKGMARITGDRQEFKGYAKQLVCRGSAREFLSYQSKFFKDGYPDLPRGTLLSSIGDSSSVANEIRVSQAPIAIME